MSNTLELDDATERLRASKRDHEERQRQAFVKAGVDWAKEEAEYDQLERVAALADEDTISGDGLIDNVIEAETGESGSFAEIREFAARLIGNPDAKLSNYQIGWYLDGVKQVWDEVADQL